MNDSIPTPKIKDRKKSGWIAASLNLICPGLGYMYCGRNILGIVAFLFVFLLFFASRNTFPVAIVFVLVIDGFLCASRYNEKLLQDAVTVANAKNI